MLFYDSGPFGAPDDEGLMVVHRTPCFEECRYGCLHCKFAGLAFVGYLGGFQLFLWLREAFFLRSGLKVLE